MCTRNHFLAIVGSSLLSGSLGAGNAAAQTRPMSVPRRPMPPAMQLIQPLPPMQPMMPLNPFMGIPNSLSNPWYLYGNMMNRYGYAMPYTAPAPTPTGEYQPGVNPPVNDIVVQLPIANGKIWINGVETKRTGSSTRHLSVPAGQNQEFKLKATWTIDGKTKTEERTVHLNGFGRQVVNFLVPEGK
jgi:hypothetical protein